MIACGRSPPSLASATRRKNMLDKRRADTSLVPELSNHSRSVFGIKRKGDGDPDRHAQGAGEVWDAVSDVMTRSTCFMMAAVSMKAPAASSTSSPRSKGIGATPDQQPPVG